MHRTHRIALPFWMGLGLLLAASTSGCKYFEENKVEVFCQPSASRELECMLKHTEGSQNVKACCTLLVQCTSGAKLDAEFCELVPAKKQVERQIPSDEIVGMTDKCEIHKVTVTSLELELE